MPKNPIHAEALRKLVSLIYKLSLENYIISSENPLTLGDSEPEPDIAILPPGDYSQNHPTTALLVAEVSNTTLSFDRRKAAVYAKGNIPEYIILNLNDRKIEWYRSPKDGSYTEIRILSHDEKFVSTAMENLSFSLDELLPTEQ